MFYFAQSRMWTCNREGWEEVMVGWTWTGPVTTRDSGVPSPKLLDID